MTPLGFFNQSITVYPKTAYNRYARVVVGAGVNKDCRFQRGTKVIMLPTGQTKIIEAILYAKADLDIHINDRVDYGSDKYQVFGLSEPVDGNGVVNHLKLTLTKWQETSI